MIVTVTYNDYDHKIKVTTIVIMIYMITKVTAISDHGQYLSICIIPLNKSLSVCTYKCIQLQCDYHDHDFDANDCNLIDSHSDPEDNLYKNHVHDWL